MSKVREIDGWIHKDSFMGESDARAGFYNYEFVNSVKAKLTIYEPEKKISISETEFDEAFNECLSDTTYAYSKEMLVRLLKQKLFGKGSEG